MSDYQGLSDFENQSNLTAALTTPRPLNIGSHRRIFRKWLQRAWGPHFDQSQSLFWDVVQTLALPYKSRILDVETTLGTPRKPVRLQLHFCILPGEPTGQKEFLQILKNGHHDSLDDTIEKAELFALQNLVKRPWFTRMWITQEIGVAKEAILLCGKTTMNWNLFDLGYSLTLLTVEMRRFLTKDVVMNGKGRLTILRRTLGHLGELTPRQQKLLTLPVLLNSFRKHKATDPIDKVFALFGITTTDIGAVQLHPDYRSSVENVYKNVALALMDSSDDLYILSNPHSSTDFARGLPSWVPDWSDTLSQPALFSRDSEATDTMSPIPIPSYKASNGTTLPPKSLSDNSNTLRLSGYIIDRIAHIGDSYAPPTHDFLGSKFETYTTISPWDSFTSMLNSSSDYSRSLEVLNDWRILALSPPSPLASLSTHSELLEQFQRTLSADWAPKGPSTAAADFHKWQKQFYAITALRALGFRRLFPALYGVGVLLGVALYWLVTGTDSAFATTMEFAQLRRLAWTEGGRLALVPREARVVLVEGADMPLVMRGVGVEMEDAVSSGGNWTLVGDSYVHGIMYGEGWEKERCGKIDIV